MAHIVDTSQKYLCLYFADMLHESMSHIDVSHWIGSMQVL